MQFALVLTVCLMTVIITVAGQVDKYEHVDLDGILSNDRVLTNYIKCLLDKGPCTAEGRQLRNDIPNAITTNCENCTTRQKEMVRKASNHVMEKHAQKWKQLVEKFDPTGEYQERFAKFLKDE